MTDTEIPQDTGPVQKPRRWLRRLALGASLAAALGVGVGAGAAAQNTGISPAAYNASQAQASSLRTQVSALSSQVSTLQTDVSNDDAAVTTAQNQAATAQQTANANAASAYRSKEAALQAQEQQVASELRTLKQELGQVQASSINADGTYIVGQDVKPGTYHTNGSGNTGANDCYYATLSSTDGSINSIISNNNFDGPETISLNGVYAFQINGPCTWVLVP